ncbi:MAG: glycoside hydrolase family 1 protein [Acidobacteria bacterium]|nr:glycoside hydrolase family 1 protein [Acidobacteriota bacterium]MBV9477656.1 glycoside hydrolase family 1 protein [Acidobacteriota bacterium]
MGERRTRFPLADRPRLWGTAVSHYQVEGDDPCDWTEWERAGRTRGGACGAAAASWTRYEDDAALAKAAGANAFRFSVSWSRIEPQRNAFDDRALARYRRFVDHLLQLGLEPAVTLFHYTHPRWFHEEAPWTSPASVDAFARFTRRVVDALGDGVRLYVPFNEPFVFLLAGYYDGQIPPGIASPRDAARVFDHLLAAHAASAAVIRELQPRAAVGVAHNMMAFAPERRWHLLDRTLARVAHRCYNSGVLEAFATGRWDFRLPPSTRFRGRRDDLPASLDFFGINYYSRLHLRCPGRERWIGDFAYRDKTGLGLTDNGWEIHPHGFEAALREAARGGFPLVVTENGLADGEDRLRGRFLREHLAALGRVEADGIPVHGYFQWSLVDNYEWLDGYEPKFGLYAVDRATMERTPRPSIDVFRELGRQFLVKS